MMCDRLTSGEGWEEARAKALNTGGGKSAEYARVALLVLKMYVRGRERIGSYSAVREIYKGSS